jgi:hypothetical protein
MFLDYMGAPQFTRKVPLLLAQRGMMRQNSSLDTRSKIIAASEAAQRLAADPNLLAVRANLDPVYAPHAQALANFNRPLLIALAENAEAYLSLDARAEMAASLASVRYVVKEPAAFAGEIDLRPQEALWRSALEEVVLRKSAIPETKAS